MKDLIVKKFLIVPLGVLFMLIAYAVLIHNAEPVSAAVTLDMAISEKVTMEQSQDGYSINDAHITVKNNGNYDFAVHTITATAQNGWTLVPANTDFAGMSKDTKQMSLTVNGTDLMGNGYAGRTVIGTEEGYIGSYIVCNDCQMKNPDVEHLAEEVRMGNTGSTRTEDEYGDIPVYEIKPEALVSKGSSKNFQIGMKISPQSNAITDEHVADLVVTIQIENIPITFDANGGNDEPDACDVDTI